MILKYGTTVDTLRTDGVETLKITIPKPKGIEKVLVRFC